MEVLLKIVCSPLPGQFWQSQDDWGHGWWTHTQTHLLPIPFLQRLEIRIEDHIKVMWHHHHSQSTSALPCNAHRTSGRKWRTWTRRRPTALCLECCKSLCLNLMMQLELEAYFIVFVLVPKWCRGELPAYFWPVQSSYQATNLNLKYALCGFPLCRSAFCGLLGVNEKRVAG